MSTSRLSSIISENRKHKGYERATALANQAKLIMAEVSEDQRALIEGIRKSETASELQQRLRLSTPVTGPALIGPISYQSRIYRAPDRLEMFSIKNKDLEAKIKGNFERFFAGYTLYEFIFEQSCYANNYDPNAMLLFEQSDQDGYSRVYPVVVSSEEAVHIKYSKWGEMSEFAFVRKQTGYNRDNAGVYEHWYFYSDSSAAEAVQINEYTPELEGEGWQQAEIMVSREKRTFAFREYDMQLGFVPAVRLGAYRDYKSEDFQGKALFYQGALPILHKFANLGSMMDVMDTTSAFPERFRYVPDCDYQNEQGDICERGTLTDGSKCPSCAGSGKKYALSEQRSIDFAFEAGMSPDDIIELSKLAHDHRPPTESLNYLNDKINAFFRMIQALIFNQDLTQAIAMKTATEVNAAVDAITNHLAPMASAIEVAWELAHKAAIAYNAADTEEYIISCSHPDDFQVSSITDVVSNLQSAISAGATTEAIAAFQRKLLLRAYPDDTNFVDSCMAFQSFLPYHSLPSEQQFAIITALPEDNPDRVLTERASYIQQLVFDELARTGNSFAEIDRLTQQSLIDAAVNKVIEERIRPYMLTMPDAPILD